MSSEKSPPRRRRSTLTPRTATKTNPTPAPSAPANPASGQNARPRPPEPGAIIDYGYLWAREDAKGQENATKTRPCYIYGVKPIDGLYIVSVMAISSSSKASGQASSTVRTESPKGSSLPNERVEASAFTCLHGNSLCFKSDRIS